MTAVQLLVSILTQAPALYAQLRPIYDDIAHTFSPQDQAAVEAAFEQAKADDAGQTTATDADLDAAAKQ